MTKEVTQEQDDSVSYIQKMIEALYENSDPVSVEAAELLERMNAKQDQGEQLARLGWQEIDCPICGGGARAFPKQEQGEPVAWVDLLKNAEQIIKNKFLYKRFIDGTPLANDIPCWMADFAQKYTKPQTKEWVGLTDEDDIDWEEGGTLRDLVKAIEAKLKDKNHVVSGA